MGCEYSGSNDDQNLGDEEDPKKISATKNDKHDWVVYKANESYGF